MSDNGPEQAHEGVNPDAQSQEEAKPNPEAEQVRKLETQLEEEKKRSSDLSKRMLYLQADMLNMQKQLERKEAQAREEATLKYVLELVSIQEDLERALSAAGKDVSHVLHDGLSMLLSRIDSDLRSESVERINVDLGSDFDPRVHEAVAYTEAEGRKEGCVLSVVSNGYTCRGRVIKPALVEVARQKPLPRGRTKGHGVGEQIEVGTSSVEEGNAKTL